MQGPTRSRIHVKIVFHLNLRREVQDEPQPMYKSTPACRLGAITEDTKEYESYVTKGEIPSAQKQGSTQNLTSIPSDSDISLGNTNERERASTTTKTRTNHLICVPCVQQRRCPVFLVQWI